jgi:putative spermidine/putrescine transport system substrate-binding protein
MVLGRGQNAWAKIDPKLVPSMRELDPATGAPVDIFGSPPLGARQQLVAEGIAYNTEIFQKNGWSPPTSWLDLQDPKYAKCFIPVSPTDGTQGWIAQLNYLNSKDYKNVDSTIAKLKPFAKDIPAWVSTNVQALDLMQRGVGCIAPAFQLRVLDYTAKGAPIKLVFPKEGGLYIGGDTYIPKNAPHPIAAQLAFNVLISAEVEQQAISAGYAIPTNTKAKRPTSGPASGVLMPSEFKSVGLHFIPLSAYDNLDDWTRKWTDLAASR